MNVKGFRANGFVANGKKKPFVWARPNGETSDPAGFVDISWFMTPAMARELAADLIRAADVAEGKTHGNC